MTDERRQDIMNQERREMIRAKLLKIAAKRNDGVPKKEFKFPEGWEYTVDDDGKVYCEGKLADGHDLEQFDELLLIQYKPLTPELKERRKQAKAYKQAHLKAIVDFLKKNKKADMWKMVDKLDLRTVRVWRLLCELEDAGLVVEIRRGPSVYVLADDYDDEKVIIEDDMPPFILRKK